MKNIVTALKADIKLDGDLKARYQTTDFTEYNTRRVALL